MRARTGRLQSCTRVQARPCARISFVWPACAHAQVLVFAGDGDCDGGGGGGGGDGGGGGGVSGGGGGGLSESGSSSPPASAAEKNLTRKCADASQSCSIEEYAKVRTHLLCYSPRHHTRMQAACMVYCSVTVAASQHTGPLWRRAHHAPRAGAWRRRSRQLRLERLQHPAQPRFCRPPAGSEQRGEVPGCGGGEGGIGPAGRKVDGPRLGVGGTGEGSAPPPPPPRLPRHLGPWHRQVV